MSDVISIAATVILSVGGGAVIVAVLSGWLGKVWASRIMEAEKANYLRELEAIKSRFLQDTERQKTALKKSEFIFEKEYQAASEFVGLLRALRPVSSRPDMEWYDACDEIARNFDHHERTLEQFLSKHGAILNDDVRDLLSRCISTAAEGKFMAVQDGGVDPQWNNIADSFYDDWVAIEKALIGVVRGQAQASITGDPS